jgi:nuclear pore complex protein Nup155
MISFLNNGIKGVVKPEQLRVTAQLIEDNLAKDNFPDLQELLQGQTQQLEAASQYHFLKLESFKNLPDFMLQQYDSLQVSSFMGIFPEINRVWMTIDNHLYLWNYDAPDGGDLINTYEDPDQVIVNVSLVKPIKGVFLEQIEYLLVVSTPLEITLLGIAFVQKGNSPRGPLTIYRTDMTCYADGVNMSSIIGTTKGRIFMRGNDGQLYELVYQAQDGWLTRKIRKLNKSASSIAVFIPSIFNWAGSDPIRMLALDDVRNLLYSVTKKNHIELISLGENGDEFNRIATISDLSDQLLRFSAFDDHITSIHPTAFSESKVIQCVAITSSGHRLYFSTTSFSGYGSFVNQKSYIPPTTLQLRYVLASPEITGSLPQQGSKIHESYYFNGLTVAAQAMDDLDRILVFAPHPGSILQATVKSMTEYASFFDVEGRTWAIAEAPNEQFHASNTNDLQNSGIHLNELASQFEFESRKIFLLTNGGITTISKERPLDLLLQLINTKSTGDTKAFQEFVTSFGVDQTCCMALAIACSHPSITSGQFGIPQNICNVASRIYFEYGGLPLMNIAQPVAGIGMAAMGVPLTTKELAYSPKHNGLAIYITRIVRPLWKRELVVQK